MTDSFRHTDPVMPDLTKRKSINWPERMVTLEIAVTEIRTAWKEMQKEAQYAMVSLAESNEKLANHFEESRRLHQRIDEQNEFIEELRRSFNSQEKLLVALIEQNKQLLDFNTGMKRTGWAILSGGTIFVFWLFQKWFEKHGGL